jgi:hypothetical protein
MTFGHAEMAQMMTESQSLITAMFVSTVCIGILLGLIIVLYRIVLEDGAADRSFKSEKSTKPVAATLTRPPPIPPARTMVRPLKLIGTIILIAAGGGGYASHYSKQGDFKSAYNYQPIIQPLAPTIEPELQVREAAARAEGINENLCEASSKLAIERTLSSAPTKELIKYVEGLKKGSYSFNWTKSGHDAAKQLGFGNRFAATYGQAAEEVGARLARKSSVHIDEIIEYFGQILREEQAVDLLVMQKDRHFPPVVYVRALQEGECSFPYVLRDTPTAQAMMNDLARAHPEVKKRGSTEPFASIYDATVAYGRNEIKRNGSVSIYRLIEQMRRAIVQSANPKVATAPSISSQPSSLKPSMPQKAPQTNSTGSGFFVTQAGHLLTNAHVVNNCTSIAVKTSGGQSGVARVIALDQNDDLALLKIERRADTTVAFRIGRPPRAGESAVVFGYPLSQLLASTGNVTTGVITALAGPLDDPHRFRFPRQCSRETAADPF